MSTMIRKSMPIAADHISPLANGRIDAGYENLKVRILFWPDEKMFKRLVYKATMATRGSDISDDEVIDDQVVEEAFRGGLNQVLEVATVSFEISGCSRGLTHELVRTRKASFAQQSQRHTDFGDAAMRMPIEIANADIDVQTVWHAAVDQSRKAYMQLTDKYDIPFQDARTVLPIGTETYIIASYPMSEFIGTYAYRACHMFYPEIVVLFGLMKDELIKTCPWVAPYVKIGCEKTKPNNGHGHMCTYQGWEKVEGHCPLPWAKENNRVWKSSKFEG
jgi:flavin-dependent thymidylate synthase